MNPAFDGVITTGAWPYVTAAYVISIVVIGGYCLRVYLGSRSEP
jgi:hypothetical protein